jgi:hypothetical protein
MMKLASCVLTSLLAGCALQPQLAPPGKVVDPLKAYGQDQDLGLACRLLMASRCAYAIAATGNLDDKDGDHYWACSAERGVVERREFADGSERINAALIELTPEAVILAFRGTLPPGGNRSDEQVLRDWGADLEADLFTDPAIAGQVHQGFDIAVRSTLADVLGVLNEWKREGRLARKKLYITGHSKGGAMASIAAPLLSGYGFRPDAIYTFAAPRAGDADFKDAYDAKHYNSWRYENRYDVVPHVPPNSTDDELVAKVFADSFREGASRFGSVGNLMYIDWGGHLTATYAGLETERKDRFNELIVPSRIAEAVINAHSSGKGDGYGKAVCQE